MRLIRSLALALSIAISAPSFAAVAVVSNASKGWNDGTTSTTLAVNATGANGLLVFVGFRNGVPVSLSSFTYNGTAMTRFGTLFTSSSPAQSIDVFYLANPASGTNNFSVTSSGTMSTESAVIWAVALSGVDTASMMDATDVNNEAVSPFTAMGGTLSAATNDLCVDMGLVAKSLATGLAANAGQTQLGTLAVSTESYGGVSTKPGAASVSMGWTYGPSATYNASWRGVCVKAGAAASVLVNPISGKGGAAAQPLVN